MYLTGAVWSEEGKGSGKAGEIRDGVLEEAGKAPVEQAVAQFVFEFSKGPTLQMFKDDTAQQTIRGDSWPSKVLGTQAPAAELLRSQLQESAVMQQCIQFVQGHVLDGGHLFGEGEVKQRRLPGGAADHA